MTKLEDWLSRACKALNIEIERGYVVHCPDGHPVRSVILIRDIGAPKGMIVVTAYEEVRDHRSCLEALGFGFSVLSEPEERESFDLESYREMFCEWGWAEGVRGRNSGSDSER